MSRSRKLTLYSCPEVTYGADPSSNGSLYLPVTLLGRPGFPKDEKSILETDFSTGRNFGTLPVVGADGWSLDFETPQFGLASACGVGVNASSVTADAQDHLFANALAAVATVAGVAVSTGSIITNLTCATDPYNAQQVIPVFEANLPSAANPRTQWGLITTDSAPYSIEPSWLTAPSSAAIAYGTKGYQPSDTGGPSVAFVYRLDDVDYTLLGGRCTKLSIVAESNKLVRLRWSFRGDSKVQEAKGSINPITTVSRSPIKMLSSPVWFGGARYETSKIEVDFGITAAVRESTEAVNGRASDEVISVGPTVMIEPLYADATLALKRAQTAGRVLVQFGSGVLSGGVLNTCALHLDQASIIEADPSDESGRIRQGAKLKASDQLVFGSAAARFLQYLRA